MRSTEHWRGRQHVRRHRPRHFNTYVFRQPFGEVRKDVEALNDVVALHVLVAQHLLEALQVALEHVSSSDGVR